MRRRAEGYNIPLEIMMLEGTGQVVIAWDWYSANTSTLPPTSRDQNKQSHTASAQSHRGIERKLMELECFKGDVSLKNCSAAFFFQSF